MLVSERFYFYRVVGPAFSSSSADGTQSVEAYGGAGTQVVAVINAIAVILMAAVYEAFVPYLNGLENHRTAASYNDALVAKTFVFKVWLFPLNFCLPYSTTVCLSQLLSACLNTTVCPQLLFACLNYCLPVSTTVCPQLTLTRSSPSS